MGRGHRNAPPGHGESRRQADGRHADAVRRPARLLQSAIGRPAAEGPGTVSRPGRSAWPGDGTRKAWPRGTSACCATWSSRHLPAVGATRPCWPWATCTWSRAISPPHAGTGSGSCRSRGPQTNRPRGPAIPTRSSIWRRSAPGWCWRRSSKARRPAPATNWRHSPSCIRRPAARWAGGKSSTSKRSARCSPRRPTGPSASRRPIGPPSPATASATPRRRRLIDVAGVAWRVPLRKINPPFNAVTASVAEDAEAPLSYHPVLVGDVVLVNNQAQVLAYRLATGKPAWGAADPAIYRDMLEAPAGELLNPRETLGTPRFTLTAHDNRLFARMGVALTGRPPESPHTIGPAIWCASTWRPKGGCCGGSGPKRAGPSRARRWPTGPTSTWPCAATTSGPRRTWPASTCNRGSCAGGSSSAAPRRRPAACSTSARTTC